MKIVNFITYLFQQSQKIKFRLLFLLIFINFAFLSMIYLFRIYEIGQMRFLISEEKKQNEKLLDVIIDVFGKDLGALGKREF